MTMRLIPRNDPEANALAYKSMEQPLRKILQDYSKRNTKGMMERITSILTSAGYDGSNGSTVLIRKADPSTIRTLEELALRLPDGPRQRMMARMYGQIGAGSLSIRKAVQDVIQYGPFLDARKMHQEAQDVLRQTAREGMYRGEFMVQKSVGVGWQMETPSVKQVDAFLKDKWSMRDATAYLKPMSQVMRDQVTESIFLGESPQKMAKRMERVDEISSVRAKRNARTITTAVANEAQMDSYKRDGIRKYRWVATFDERTCPACGAMDGREFELGKGQYPPIHPNCRCTTVAVLDKEAQDKVNAIIEAHKNDKGAKYVPPGMTYEEWAAKNITPAKPRKPKADQPTKRQQTVAKAKPVTVESYPPAFSATKPEAKNTQRVADFINRREDADQNVKRLYGNMAKMENIESQGVPFKVTHGTGSGVVQCRTYLGSGKLYDAKIAYPKMESDDDVGAAQTTLHEQMHLMDMYSRDDPTTSGNWFSSTRPEMQKAITETTADIGEEPKKLFGDFHEAMAAEKARLEAIRDAELTALREKSRTGQIDSKTYMKEFKRAYKDCSDAEDRYNRAWGGGGVNQLEDIYDALSGGTFRDKGTVKYGHGGKYYSSKDSRIHEILANYGSLSVTRPDLIDMLRKDKPGLCKALDETIQAMNDKWGIE